MLSFHPASLRCNFCQHLIKPSFAPNSLHFLSHYQLSTPLSLPPLSAKHSLLLGKFLPPLV